MNISTKPHELKKTAAQALILRQACKRVLLQFIETGRCSQWKCSESYRLTGEMPELHTHIRLPSTRQTSHRKAPHLVSVPELFLDSRHGLFDVPDELLLELGDGCADPAVQQRQGHEQ